MDRSPSSASSAPSQRPAAAEEHLRQLKKEGKFDELRKQILAKIVANGKLASLSHDAAYIANKYLDSLALPCTLPENELSATLRNRLDRSGIYSDIDPIVNKVLLYDVDVKQMISDSLQQSISPQV